MDAFLKSQQPGQAVTPSSVKEFLQGLPRLPDLASLPTASLTPPSKVAALLPDVAGSPLTPATGPDRNEAPPSYSGKRPVPYNIPPTPSSPTAHRSHHIQTLPQPLNHASQSPLYNEDLAHDEIAKYITPEGSILYRNLVAAPWVKTTKLCLTKISTFVYKEARGPEAVIQSLANSQGLFGGVCIFHLVLNRGDCDTDTFHCSGPLGGRFSDYYTKFRSTMVLPSGVCWSCWCPVDTYSQRYFQHPPIGRDIKCSGRNTYEDLYRGLCYIILRCSALRNAIFTWLGCPKLTSKFTSTADWVRWLVYPTSREFTKLTNYMTLVWAYFEMFAEGVLPKEELKFDGMLCARSHLHFN